MYINVVISANMIHSCLPTLIFYSSNKTPLLFSLPLSILSGFYLSPSESLALPGSGSSQRLLSWSSIPLLTHQLFGASRAMCLWNRRVQLPAQNHWFPGRSLQSSCFPSNSQSDDTTPREPAHKMVSLEPLFSHTFSQGGLALLL